MVSKAKKMTNLKYLIAALTDQIDDGGASRECVVYYNIACPYGCGDPRAHCFGRLDLVGHRDTCVACKEEWLESEVDE